MKNAIDDYLKTKEGAKLQKSNKSIPDDEDTNSESDGNYGTMVFNDENSDNFSTTVVNSNSNYSTTVFSDTNENFSSMVMKDDSESENEKNSYLAAIKYSSDQNKQSPSAVNIIELNKEVQQLKQDLEDFKAFIGNQLQSQRAYLEDAVQQIRKEIRNNK